MATSANFGNQIFALKFLGLVKAVFGKQIPTFDKHVTTHPLKLSITAGRLMSNPED